MKPSEQNSLERALANRVPQTPHPEADVLNAFAEGSLTDGEREQVLAHVADCTTCREVLALADPVAPEAGVAPLPPKAVPVTPMPQAPQGRWLAWGAGVAALAVLSGGLFVYQLTHGRTNEMARAGQPRPITAAPAQATSEPSTQPGSGANSPTSPASAPRSATSSASPAPLPASRAAEPNAAVATQEPAARPERSTADAAAPARMAGTLAATPPAEQAAQFDRIAKLAPPPPSNAAQASSNSVVTRKSAGPVNSSNIAENAPLYSRNVAPPVMQTEQRVARAKASSVPAHSLSGSPALPAWRATSEGRVEWQDADGTWHKAALPARVHFRAVATIGNLAWAGGSNHALYRSTDFGVTWAPVSLPGRGNASAPVTHIAFSNAQTGTVTAEDGTTWTTHDGGQSWQ